MNIEKYKFIAHRGIHTKNGDNVENSIPAFKIAVEKNIGIELDVHITKDDEIVVVHDHNLKNITGIDKVVEELNLNEIKQMNLFNTNNKIPTLNEVLDVIDGKVPIVIEIKNEGRVGRLESKLYSLLKEYKGEYVIESFNPLTLLWFKKHDKNIIRGQLSAKKIDSISKFLNFFLSKMLFNIFTKPEFIAYNIFDITEKMYKKYNKKGIYLIGWTLKNMNEYHEYSNICDGLIFDNYEEFRNIIESEVNSYEKEN